MSELFREIDEELRQERALVFLRRHGLKLLIAASALIIGLTANMIWRDMTAVKNASRTAKLITITGSGLYGDDTVPDPAALKKFVGNSTDSLAVLVLFRQAGILAQNGKDDEAVKIYKEIIKQAGIDPVLRDYARYLEILRRTDHDQPDDLIIALKPLTENKIWGPAARELTGVLEFRAGRVERSVKILDDLVKDPETDSGIRNRAGQLAILYRQSSPVAAEPKS